MLLLNEVLQYCSESFNRCTYFEALGAWMEVEGVVRVVRSVAQVSFLEVEVETLTEQLHSPEACEHDQNGSVTVDDLDHIHKVNRELEQQLTDKNRVGYLFTPLCSSSL